MECSKYRKIMSAVLFAVGTIMAWGGMLYAANDPNHFRLIGIIIALIGYGFFFGGALIYETITDHTKQNSNDESPTHNVPL